ncbi:MAG: hypothetical protein LBH43_21180 [Treponema sp.]|jgi:hypothetical protein|nr:hypothetical protein [Treponema sp.]
MSYINEKEFDICAICKNNGKSKCEGCEIRYASLNCFQLNEIKVIVNSKVKLYAHWVNCVKNKCGEYKDGKCGGGVFVHDRCDPVRVFVPLPKDYKCLFPNYFPCSGIDISNGGFEKTEAEETIEDIPF